MEYGTLKGALSTMVNIKPNHLLLVTPKHRKFAPACFASQISTVIKIDDANGRFFFEIDEELSQQVF